MENIDFVTICNYCRDLIKDPLFDFDTLAVFKSLYSGPMEAESIERFLSWEDRRAHNDMDDAIKSWLVDGKHITWSPLWRLLLFLRLDHACANLHYLYPHGNDPDVLLQFSPLAREEYGAHWALTNFWLATGHSKFRAPASSFSLGLPYERGSY